MGISDPKNFKNPDFCKLIRPVWANPLIDIHEIYKFYAPMGSTKIFKFGVIRCITEGVI